MKQVYSIWGVFAAKDEVVLQQINDSLAKKQKVSSFRPHITILGGLEGDKSSIIKKTKLLSSKIKSQKIKIQKIDDTDSFYRCIILLCRKDSSLIQANLFAQELFSANKEFTSHISVLYGDFDSKTRALLKKTISAPNEVTMTHLELYTTNGNHSTWKKIASYELK